VGHPRLTIHERNEGQTVSSAVVFGGYGTFGALVARELARRNVAVTIVGRDLARAQSFARALGTGHRGIAADVTCSKSCMDALFGQAVAVNCAGPFGPFDATLLESCLEVGCHYVDIADDRDYTALVRSRGEGFRQRGLAAVFGCSSLPAISGALALKALGHASSPPMRARVTLFIGNDNPKGHASIQSLVNCLGKPIRAPQGIIRGFRDREVVPLPAPFGRRAVFNFESPEYDLLPHLLSVRSVSVKVGFESRLATYACALLAILRVDYGVGTARLLQWLGNPFHRFGTSGGAVMTELFFSDCTTQCAALVARLEGQRMAALPCALVAHDLAVGTPFKSGAWTAYEFLGVEVLLDELIAAGFDLKCDSRRQDAN
jgi:hypothetical protein